MLPVLPKATSLLGDRDYNTDGLHKALTERGVAACIPPKANRKVQIPHDAAPCRRRHKIEIMFGRPKDRRRIHTR